MQGPPSGVSHADGSELPILSLPHPNIYQTTSHTIVTISGALWRAQVAGLLPVSRIFLRHFLLAVFPSEPLGCGQAEK